MLKKIIFATLLIIVFQSVCVFAQDKTIVSNANAGKMLLGKHKLSLQWISWDYFGTAIVTNKNGVLYLKGEQKQRGGKDYLKVDGTIASIDKNEFTILNTLVKAMHFQCKTLVALPPSL